MAQIILNIDKKYALPIVVTLVLFTGIFAAWAYNSAGTGGNPAVMGHSVDEIDWSHAIPSDLHVNGSIYTSDNVQVNGRLHANTICFGPLSTCRTSWPSGGSTGSVSGIVVGGGLQGNGQGTQCTHWGSASCNNGVFNCPSGSSKQVTGVDVMGDPFVSGGYYSVKVTGNYYICVKN